MLHIPIVKADDMSVFFLLQILEEFNLISKKEQPFGREISGVVTNGIHCQT